MTINYGHFTHVQLIQYKNKRHRLNPGHQLSGVLWSIYLHCQWVYYDDRSQHCEEMSSCNKTQCILRVIKLAGSLILRDTLWQWSKKPWYVIRGHYGTYLLINEDPRLLTVNSRFLSLCDFPLRLWFGYVWQLWSLNFASVTFSFLFPQSVKQRIFKYRKNEESAVYCHGTIHFMLNMFTFTEH